MSGPNAADWAVFLQVRQKGYWVRTQYLRACLQKWPSQRSADLVILNRAHGVLVGMGVKLRGPLMHTDHGHGPGLISLLSQIAVDYRSVHFEMLKFGH